MPLAQSHGLAGWRWLFLLEGLPAVVLGIAAYFYLDDGPAQARWLLPEEKSAVLAALEDEHVTKARSGDVRHSLGEVCGTGGSTRSLRSASPSW